MNLNGGALEVVGGDYDPGTGNIQMAIGPAGGTFISKLGSIISINDGPAQLSGSGDILFAGGGRYNLNGGTPTFPNFTGKVTVAAGILIAGNTTALGGRPDQTITLQPGAAIINGAGFGLGLNGLPNNIVAQGNNEFYAVGGSRVYGGDIQLTGTSTFALMERDNPASERQIFLNGRISGTGVTLNVFAAVNTPQSTPSVLYFSGGSNDITGTVNVNANAIVEVRAPGSLGLNDGDVTVNLNGASSRLNLRHFQNGDYHLNVNVNNTADVTSDRLAGFAGGGLQILSINNLTLNGDNNVVTIGGGNSYHTRVGGTATFNAPTSTILNVTASDLILENGLTFGTPSSTLDKRGGLTAILRGPTNHTGRLIIQQGLILLQDNGTLAGTSAIDLRGGELRVDNSAVVNPNRINDAASISLGGGVLRITGAETLGTVSAVGGTTIVISNPSDELVPNPLTLTGFTRAIGSVVQFQAPDVGAAALAVGQNTNAQTRVGSRIYIPGQANTTQTIPGFIGNNNLDFVQYDGTTIDSGFPLGVQEMRNPGNVNSPQNYSNDTAETAWNDTIILRTSVANTTVALTANRALDAWKIENTVTTLNQGAFDLRIEAGGILAVSAAPVLNSTTGRLYAGAATATAGTAELFIGGGAQTITINSIISDNPLSGQKTALVKTGQAGTVLTVSGANTYTGGTFATIGTLNVLTNTALGGAANPITLSGGTLQFNIPNAASGLDLGGLGQSVAVNANSLIVLDNGALAGINNSLTFGPLSINGPYTLGVRGFDSMDVNFVGTHTFIGTPTIDLPQAGSGSNPNVAGSETFVTLNGGITGSGFFVSSSGSTDNTQARLRIGGGAADATANTYVGKVTLLQGAFNEDMFVELNKAAGTTAITGDIEINAGTIFLNRANQIADASNVVNNHGVLDFNGQNETIASIVMNGGDIYTNNAVTGSTPASNVVTVTGPVTVNGYDDITDAAHPTTALNLGLMIGNNSTLNVGGLLTIGTYGRVHLAEGATQAVLNVNGGLQLTGALLNQSSGPGPNIVRLSSDVTTLAAVIPSNIGNSTDSDTFPGTQWNSHVYGRGWPGGHRPSGQHRDSG